MNYPDQHQRMEFDFEGQFLGFVSHDGKLKYVRLQVLSEEMLVKLPKAVQMVVGPSLQPGASIQVTGSGKFDRQTQELKLKAHQIIPLPDRGIQTATATPPNLGSSVIHDAKSTPKNKPKIKVLVCQKSGCLKKGGRGLCEALGQLLRDRGLEQYVTIERTGCVKCCSAAPNLVIMPGNQKYTEVRLKTLPQIADAIAHSLVKN